MALYLLDTNIVLRLANADDVQHELVSEAVVRILAQEQEFRDTPQATRSQIAPPSHSSKWRSPSPPIALLPLDDPQRQHTSSEIALPRC
jgi:hypothetical protein